eukprot:m.142439 g.142439  ORF g.142439 m.142439 type:complete len:86 (+) comp52617_c0_seq3:860-1117(+)
MKRVLLLGSTPQARSEIAVSRVRCLSSCGSCFTVIECRSFKGANRMAKFSKDGQRSQQFYSCTDDTVEDRALGLLLKAHPVFDGS